MNKKINIIAFIFLTVLGIENIKAIQKANNNMIDDNKIEQDSSGIINIIYKEGHGFFAVDINRNELFEVFPFDNGPDYPSEGMFRIVKNGKIGYANLKGEIIISPQFDAALPFINGMAAFCDGCSERIDGEHKTWIGGKWGFINNSGVITIPAKFDSIIEQFKYGVAEVTYLGAVILINKNGEQVDMNNMKYNEWINLLGNTAHLIAQLFYDNKVTAEMKWLSNDKYNFGSNNYLQYLRLDIINDQGINLLEYDIIPWQNFSLKPENDFLISLTELITVTDYAIVYSTFKPREKNSNDIRLIERFNKLFETALEKNINQQPDDYEIVVPKNVQLISNKLFRNYVELQIAEPGTILPVELIWEKFTKGKMIYIQSVPDFGVIKKRWIKTIDMPIDTYYTSVEQEILEYFEEAIEEVTSSPEIRNEVFINTKSKIRELFSAANSYVNFLNEKYEERLRRWLFIDEDLADRIYEYDQNDFGDYQPKQTPDTILDYMPELTEVFENLPNAAKENFLELIQLFEYYKNNSIVNPGQWEVGNLVLGANPKEYKPSRDELLLAEVGCRIKRILKAIPNDQLQNLLKENGVDVNKFEYKDFSFIHVDIMGSGRFFYVDKIDTLKIFQEE
ncbi:MAG: WG repeat-containing protein [Melioribacteraceae bacterium]|nr:WG repeat-containing protein [Melioribacteraceae bacterium]